MNMYVRTQLGLLILLHDANCLCYFNLNYSLDSPLYIYGDNLEEINHTYRLDDVLPRRKLLTQN